MLMKVIMKHRYGYCCPPHRWYHCFDHGVPILDSGVHSTTKSFLQLSHLLEFKAYIIKNITKSLNLCFLSKTFSRIPNTLSLYHTVPCRWGVVVCCETLDMGKKVGPVFRQLCEVLLALIVLLQLVASALFY